MYIYIHTKISMSTHLFDCLTIDRYPFKRKRNKPNKSLAKSLIVNPNLFLKKLTPTT